MSEKPKGSLTDSPERYARAVAVRKKFSLRTLEKQARDIKELADRETSPGGELSFLRSALRHFEDVVLPKARKQKRKVRDIQRDIQCIRKRIAELEQLLQGEV